MGHRNVVELAASVSAGPIGILFDHDGVLVAMNRARLVRQVLEIVPILEGDLAARWMGWLGGRALSDTLGEEEAVAAFLDELATTAMLGRAARRRLLTLGLVQCARAFDDAPAALREAKRRGLRVGVLSHDWLGPARMLDAVGLGKYFDVALSRRRNGAAEPDVRAYRAAAAQLGIAEDRCLFLDDRHERVEAARALGMVAWRVDRSRAEHDLDERVVRDLSALPRILDRWVDRAGTAPTRA